jgi:hypothetical protein
MYVKQASAITMSCYFQIRNIGCIRVPFSIFHINDKLACIILAFGSIQ